MMIICDLLDYYFRLLNLIYINLRLSAAFFIPLAPETHVLSLRSLSQLREQTDTS